MYQQIFELHSKILKAMSHPKRLEIIQLLRDQALTVSQIQHMLDLPQANLSQHLMVMREAGVVETVKNGKEVTYSIAHQNFVEASHLIRQVLVERHKDGPLADELTMSMNDLVPVVSDPICGMRLSPKIAAYAHKHQGETYYFCASGCYQKFISKNSKETL